jgi:hypothetical protein
MSEIKLQPWKQIIVHDLVQLEPDELFSLILKGAMGHETAVLPDVFWRATPDGEGFAWIRNLLDGSEVAAQECLQSRLHITFLWFCRLDEYRPEIRVTYKNQEGILRLCEADSFEAVSIPAFLKAIQWT